jgi:hypothetical protein
MGMSQRAFPTGFIPPCLPTKAQQPPSGALWLHEIKHDGFRVIACKDGDHVRLYGRLGNSLTERFPLIVQALLGLGSRSCIIDGEAVCCDDTGVPSFNRIRYRRDDGSVFLYAFDLIELNGDDLRRERLEVRKATLASVLRRASARMSISRPMALPCSLTPARWALRASCRSTSSRATCRAAHRTGSRARIRRARRCGGRRRKIGTSGDGDNERATDRSGTAPRHLAAITPWPRHSTLRSGHMLPRRPYSISLATV